MYHLFGLSGTSTLKSMRPYGLEKNEILHQVPNHIVEFCLVPFIRWNGMEWNKTEWKEMEWNQIKSNQI